MGDSQGITCQMGSVESTARALRQQEEVLLRYGAYLQVRRLPPRSKAFDVWPRQGENARGRFLKISEVVGSDRSSVIVPANAIPQFYEALSSFLKG
eukprot:scaffold2799_cov408-Prasinococcus_capsulatus_cf.AAC.32